MTACGLGENRAVQPLQDMALGNHPGVVDAANGVRHGDLVAIEPMRKHAPRRHTRFTDV